MRDAAAAASPPWSGCASMSSARNRRCRSPRAWSMGLADPVGWALGVLGFASNEKPGRKDLQRRFRDLLREAHPDHGGEASEAASRIADLTEARRILLAS